MTAANRKILLDIYLAGGYATAPALSMCYEISLSTARKHLNYLETMGYLQTTGLCLGSRYPKSWSITGRGCRFLELPIIYITDNEVNIPGKLIECHGLMELQKIYPQILTSNKSKVDYLLDQGCHTGQFLSRMLNRQRVPYVSEHIIPKDSGWVYLIFDQPLITASSQLRTSMRHAYRQVRKQRVELLVGVDSGERAERYRTDYAEMKPEQKRIIEEFRIHQISYQYAT